MNKPRLLILSYTNPLSDPRVLRQINFLREEFRITVAGIPPAPEQVDFIPVRKVSNSPLRKLWWAGMLLARNSQPFLKRYQLENKSNVNRRFDLVLVNDADPLPLAFELAEGAPVFFDAHEYYPREFDNSFVWNVLFGAHYTRLCHKYIPRCAGMSTVCKGIGDEYERVFGVRPLIVRNVPPDTGLAPQPVGDNIRLIHHGVASPSRCLELMMTMMDHVDSRFTLDLMLTGSGNYWRKIRDMAAAHPRINFIPPVAMPEICKFINGYDLGVYMLPPAGFNNTHALPNKLFEFMQARLGIMIGPSPEMAAIVKEYDMGVVAADFAPETLAAELNRLTEEQVMQMKNNAHQAAVKVNAAVEINGLRDALMTILEGEKT